MKAALLLGALGALGLGSVIACDTEDATTAIVDNRDPSVVYRAWWVTTYFDDPVGPAASSAPLRSVPATGTAYALLAPGWDPASDAPPTSLAVRQSRTPLSAERGEELHIAVSDDTFLGSCTAPLSEGDRAVLAERIFPGELAGFTYDASTCLFAPTPAEVEAGTDSGTDAADGG